MPLVALLILALGVYAYYLLMRWLLFVAGPEVLVVASLGAIGYVVVSAGRALYTVFAAGRTRRLAFVPLTALLTLIYIDFVVLLLVGVLEIGRVTVAQVLIQPTSQIATRAILNAQLIEVFSVFGVRSTVSLLFLSSAAKMSLLTPFLLLARGLRSARLSTRQPAYLQYFFADAREDIGRVLTAAGEDVYAQTEGFIKKLFAVNMTGAGVIIWPLSLTLILALVPGAVVGLGVAMVLVVMHTFAIAVFAVLNLLLAALLYAIERAVLFARRGHAICPYSTCHSAIPLPIYRCPNPKCGRTHDRLIPGRTGLLTRICECNHALPTLSWNGKDNLSALCSACHQSMPSALFSESMHIPIYGAPSSGKSMLMLSTTVTLIEGKDSEGNPSDLTADLIDGTLRRAYEKVWKARFDSGESVDKTSEVFPDAFLLKLAQRHGNPMSLYLYDAAGEALADQAVAGGHEFLRYADGLMFVIDPMSLPGVQSPGEFLPTGTATADPEDGFGHLVNALEGKGLLGRGRRHRNRLAVVLTKTDLDVPPVLRGGDHASTSDWSRAGEERSAVLETWLASVAPGLVNRIAVRFDEVRYFSVSAQGDTRPGEAFRPRGVLEPLKWLASSRSVLTHPRRSRAAARLRELCAAAVVVGLCLAVPYGVWSLPEILGAAHRHASGDDSNAGTRIERRHPPPPPNLVVKPVLGEPADDP